MLLKGDATTIVKKWGSIPPHAGPKIDLASDGQFSTRVVHATFDSLSQTWLLRFCNKGETAQDRVNVYRSRSKDWLRVKRISIQ